MMKTLRGVKSLIRLPQSKGTCKASNLPGALFVQSIDYSSEIPTSVENPIYLYIDFISPHEDLSTAISQFVRTVSTDEHSTKELLST